MVVDSNVTSELMRAAPGPVVVAWLRARPVMGCPPPRSLAVIRCGIDRLSKGRRPAALRTMADEVLPRSTRRCRPSTIPASRAPADIVVGQERVGRPINGVDAQIASIGRTHQATLATRIARDFEGTGVSVVNPWAWEG